MFTRKTVVSAAIALGFAFGMAGMVAAATPHGHAGHDAPALGMKLDNGQRWPTDEALRNGMTQIRAAVAASLPRIHEGRYGASEFASLADKVQEQVDYVVANCKLPEEADLHLHVALTQVLDGIGALRGDAGQEDGVRAIVAALNAYGDHFDHPGWTPLGD